MKNPTAFKKLESKSLYKESKLNYTGAWEKFLNSLRWVILVHQRSEGLISLSMTTDKTTHCIGLRSLVEFASGRINVGNVDLHTTEVVGRQDSVSPRAKIQRLVIQNMFS